MDRILTYQGMKEFERTAGQRVMVCRFGETIIEEVAQAMNALEFTRDGRPIEGDAVLANVRARIVLCKVTRKLYGFSSYLAQAYYNDKHDLNHRGEPRRRPDFNIPGWDL